MAHLASTVRHAVLMSCPKYSIAFIAEVPHMSIDDSCFEFPSDNGPSIRLVINQQTESRTYEGVRAAIAGTWTQNAFEAMLTITQQYNDSVAIWLVSDLEHPPTPEKIDDLFWTDCLGILDEVSFAYRVVTGGGVGEISPDHLRSPVFYLVYDNGEPTEQAGSLIRPPRGPTQPLGTQHLQAISAVVAARWRGEPFFEWRRWVERAKDDLAAGFGAPAVMSIQAALETFFAELRMLLLIDADTRRASQPRDDPEPSFHWIVQSVGRLVKAGNWDVNAATPLGQYWRDLYLLRNRVVHASYRPTVDEVGAAFAAHDALRAWIAELLLAQPRRFPRTIRGFPGPAWLEERGRMTNYLRSAFASYDAPGRRYWTDVPEN